MDIYSFAAIVEGLDLDDEFQNAGLERLDYVVVASRTGGVTYIDVDVPAPSGVGAALRVIGDLGRMSVSIVRIDLDLVNTTDIADRLGVSRETVRLWSTGERRSGFPNHFSMVGDSLIWVWSVVFDWAISEGLTDLSDGRPISCDVIEGLNGAFAHNRSRWADGWLKPRSAAAQPRLAKVIPIRRKVRSDWESEYEQAAQ